MTRRAQARIVVVPVDQALAYTAERGWHVLQAPPPWWLAEQEALLEQEAAPVDVPAQSNGSALLQRLDEWAEGRARTLHEMELDLLRVGRCREAV